MPIGQQRRRVNTARGAQRAGRGPRPVRRIIQLGAGREAVSAGKRPPRPAPSHWAATSPYETACGVQRTGCRPRPAPESYSSSARLIATAAIAPRDQQHFPLGSNVAVWLAAVFMRAGLPSTSRWPDRTAPRWKDQSPSGLAVREAPRDQHLAIGQQRRRVTIARRGQRAGGVSKSPWPDRTAPRWPDSCRCCSPRDQHLAVGQQRRRVRTPRGGQRAGRRPQCRWPDHTVPRGLVRNRRSDAPRDQHLPIGQQRRRVITACGVSAPVVVQVPRGRIVQFRAGSKYAAQNPTAPPATSTFPLGSNVAV